MDRQKILESKPVRLEWENRFKRVAPADYAALVAIIRDWTAGTFAADMSLHALAQGVQKQLPDGVRQKCLKSIIRGITRIQEELSNGPQQTDKAAGKRTGKKPTSNRRTTGGAA